MNAKKSLGQHFLRDRETLERIADEAGITPDDTVLEIGPGHGSLTRALLDRAGTVIAVEKDREMIPLLEKTFEREIEDGKLILVEGDALDFDPTRFTERPYKVVANIPYYITGKFLRNLFASDPLPTTVVLLIQEEVAERIAKSEKESLLSLSIKVYGVPRYCFAVPRERFSPPPAVDSAVIAIEGVSRDFFADVDEAAFFSTLKKAFSQKRKTLINTLFANDKERGRAILAKAGATEKARPENLSRETWKQLVQLIT